MLNKEANAYVKGAELVINQGMGITALGAVLSVIAPLSIGYGVGTVAEKMTSPSDLDFTKAQEKILRTDREVQLAEMRRRKALQDDQDKEEAKRGTASARSLRI